MADVPTQKKPVTKAVRAVVAAPVKAANAAPVVAKTAVAPAKPPVAAAKPVAAKSAPIPVSAPKVEAPKAEAPKPATALAKKPEWKVEAPALVPLKAEAATAAVVAAPKVEPVAVEPAKIEVPKIATPKTEPAAPPVAAAATLKGTIMTDINTATAEFQTRAKDAATKGTQAIQDLVEFSKGNVEALVASGRVAAKGAEDIAKYSAEYGRATVEKANATAKQFAAVKSPTEFFQLQGDVAKQTLDALVAEGSKFAESYLKLLGEIAQPLSNRVSVAVDKVKTSVAA